MDAFGGMALGYLPTNDSFTAGEYAVFGSGEISDPIICIHKGKIVRQ